MVSTAKRIRSSILTKCRDTRQRLVNNSNLGRKLSLSFKTNHDKIDLITTSFCNSMCYDCSQMCRQAPAREHISVAQVQKFLDESVKAGKKWKKITVSGGESILEENCLAILELLRKHKVKHDPKLQIVLLSNGRGEKVKQLLKQVPNDIKIINSNKTSSFQSAFRSINTAPIDEPEHKNANFKSACRLTKNCGMALNWNGYYCCSTAGAIDRVLGLNLGRKKLPGKDDDFGDQKNAFCRYCGYFLSSNYKNEKGFQSPSWKKAFNNYSKKKPKLDLY